MDELNSLLKQLTVKQQNQKADGSISGISYHSQSVQEGHLFVCIRGYQTDGHKFLADAVSRGCKAAIVEKIQYDIDIPQYQVENSRTALARVSSLYYDEPSRNLNVIGVTATNGKTSTTYMINDILEANQFETGLIGTVNVKIGKHSYPAELTTPESLEAQYFLKRMTESQVSHVTMEVSSAALEMHRSDFIDYNIVSFNNIGREHIDTHGSFENYVAAKSKLITNAKPDSFAILNMDDDISASLADQTEAKVVTFSVEKNNGDVICKDLDLSTGRPSFTFELRRPLQINESFTYEPMAFKVEMAVPGIHSVYNAMVAITAALLSEVPVSVIQTALKTFKGVERRFQFIYESDCKIVDDHFANPGNIDITMGTLTKMDFNDLHMVYAIRGQRGPVVNRENAEKIADWAKELNLTHLIATKSVSNVTKRDVVTKEEEDAFMDVMTTAGISVSLYDELPDAIQAALKKINKDDLVLLAGCQGMDDGAEIALTHVKTLIG